LISVQPTLLQQGASCPFEGQPVDRLVGCKSKQPHSYA